LKKSTAIPVEVVFSPSWWHLHAGISFDRDFFFDPRRRVEDEMRMERVLHERWGRCGIGQKRPEERPEIGAVHLASGFLLSEMLGCRVAYHEDAAPTVLPGNVPLSGLEGSDAFASPVFLDFQRMVEALQGRYGRVCGDVNWSGVLNLALDLRGQQLFLDMLDEKEACGRFLDAIFDTVRRFTDFVACRTGTTSISVNRAVRHLEPPVFLHSECSLTMISTELYERFLKKYDTFWSLQKKAFGIHYCGRDPHRFAATFATLPKLDFLDVGWGGDVAAVRKALPTTFLNLRLSPAELVRQSPSEIESTVRGLIADSHDRERTGVCCINLDHQVDDRQVDAIFEAVAQAGG
jgi:hypothetical protein